MKDRIVLTGMRFYGYHGVYPEETRLGQVFLIDVELFTNTRLAGESDELCDTIDYGAVYQAVEQVVTGQRHNLIETVAERVATRLLGDFEIDEVITRVHKPHAPMPGPFESVMVEIRRNRT